MALQLDREGVAAWLATRPQIIRDLYARFPMNVAHRRPNGLYLYTVGYNENGNVLVSDHCPFVDYAIAVATKHEVHPDCLAALERVCMDDWTGPR